MFKRVSLPIQLLIVVGAVFIFGRFLSLDAVRFFYTFSLAFKEVLGFCLPFIIFSFIVAGILSLKKNAIVVIPIIFLGIVISNVVVILTSYFVGKNVLPFLTNGAKTEGILFGDSLQPFFTFKMPVLLESTHAMLAALGIGVVLTFLNFPKIESCLIKLKDVVEFLFKKIFIPFLPVYVLGFLLEINHKGDFISLFNYYGRALGLIIVLQFLYLFLMYLLASGFSFKKTWVAIKNAIPSYLTAFSTMSSTGAIPVTLEAAKKNTKNKALSSVAIPIFANVHLIGDGITVPILSLVTLSLFIGVVPSFATFASFAFYFCLIMLGTSGVPGGGIIVIIPILKSILGFSPEMVGIITTLYLLQDSLGTAGNVMGDGALVMIVNKGLKWLKIA